MPKPAATNTSDQMRRLRSSSRCSRKLMLAILSETACCAAAGSKSDIGSLGLFGMRGGFRLCVGLRIVPGDGIGRRGRVWIVRNLGRTFYGHGIFRRQNLRRGLALGQFVQLQVAHLAFDLRLELVAGLLEFVHGFP